MRWVPAIGMSKLVDLPGWGVERGERPPSLVFVGTLVLSALLKELGVLYLCKVRAPYRRHWVGMGTWCQPYEC